MTNQTHASLMQLLAVKHEVLLPLIGNNPVHYLDVPFYGNVGDLLIMQGTLAFFKKHNIHVTEQAMYFNYSPNLANDKDVIVFQGGGNFGDIYGPFQAFRERVISALPNNRIIILPQSIHFEDEHKLAQCCDLFSRHQDLHICVRDIESEQIAKRMTRNVYLLPDMAHQLWPIKPSVTPSKELLYLSRRDQEAKNNSHLNLRTFDWADLVGQRWTFFLSQIAERSIYHLHRFGLNRPFVNTQAELWQWQASKFIDKAVQLFADHRQVKSDRLHAHILSCLMSMPNEILDNSYGKNSRYIKQWTIQSPLVTLSIK